MAIAVGQELNPGRLPVLTEAPLRKQVEMFFGWLDTVKKEQESAFNGNFSPFGIAYFAWEQLAHPANLPSTLRTSEAYLLIRNVVLGINSEKNVGLGVRQTDIIEVLDYWFHNPMWKRWVRDNKHVNVLHRVVGEIVDYHKENPLQFIIDNNALEISE